jgi:hypothetical protein
MNLRLKVYSNANHPVELVDGPTCKRLGILSGHVCTWQIVNLYEDYRTVFSLCKLGKVASRPSKQRERGEARKWAAANQSAKKIMAPQAHTRCSRSSKGAQSPTRRLKRLQHLEGPCADLANSS